MDSKEADEQVDRGPSDPVERNPAEGAAFTAVTHRRRLAPVAVAVAAIAFLGFALLSKGAATPVHAPIVGTALPSSEAAAATSSVAPPLAPTPLAAADPPSLDPNATPYPVFFSLPLSAGITQLVPAGPTPVRLTVTLPDGWEQASPAMFVKPNYTAGVSLSIGAWRIAHVNEFPCRWSSQRYSDDDVIDTVDGQAQALSDWWGQDPNLAPFFSNSSIAPIAVKPRPGTIASHDAMYVEVLIPSVFDFSQCDAGQLVLWQTADGHVRYGLGPDEQLRIWVVDVDGHPIVIAASSPLSPPPADEAELQTVIDSIVIEPGPPPPTSASGS
jgi:hypothetical protein